MLITIEGIDGAGKDTVAFALKERLVLNGVNSNKIVILNEPSINRLGEIARRESTRDDIEYHNITMAMLMVAARTDNLLSTIIPMVKNGFTVICTRSSLSTLVYQIPGIVTALTPGVIRAVNIAESILTLHSVKELSFLITCDVATSISRMKQRDVLDKFEDVESSVIEERSRLYRSYGSTLGFIEVSNDGELKDTIDEIMGVIENGNRK